MFTTVTNVNFDDASIENMIQKVRAEKERLVPDCGNCQSPCGKTGELDQVDYSEKLTAIIQNNNIQSVTIVRMEVPCCGGLEMAAKKALQNSGKFLPWQVITIGIDGKTIE